MWKFVRHASVPIHSIQINTPNSTLNGKLAWRASYPEVANLVSLPREFTTEHTENTKILLFFSVDSVISVVSRFLAHPFTHSRCPYVYM